MRRRQPNHRLVKTHFSYTVEEVARLFGLHKNSVRGWIKAGLPTIDGRRPTLVHGRELAVFLEQRRRAGKQTCRAGELYCVRCRSPKRPAGNMAEYMPITATSGNLRALCAECESLMHRRVARAKIDVVARGMEVTFSQAHRRIEESDGPSVDCGLQKGIRTDDNAQR